MAEAEQQPDVFVTRKAVLIATGVAVAVVVIPFWFWMDTWFGRKLDDTQIRAYLADADAPRKAQHALAQISERITQGDESVRRWYPDVLALARHELPELRLTVAWLMGDDTANEQFHEALLELLRDAHPMVRRNAALALTKFGDPSGREEIRGMLKPYRVKSSRQGIVRNRLQPGDSFDSNALLARIEQENEKEPLDIRAPFPGIVQEPLHAEGAQIDAGDAIVVIRPESLHALQALLGLYIVGTMEDIELIKPYQRRMEGIDAGVVRQAGLTAEQIRKRAAEGIRDQPAAANADDAI